MGKYGATAVRAVELLHSDVQSADAAWRKAMNDVFSNSPRDKCCPREAFVGLCDAGLVKRVGAHPYGKGTPGLNRTYAITAVHLIGADPQLAYGGRIQLWKHVMKKLEADLQKSHNGQMDVVLTLWERGLIDTSMIRSV